jgi:CubicO group peptidase (beta-lactamase class C family)
MYGFDVNTGYSSCRGERFAVGTTFGHTGFTGTMFWVDPPNDCYFILLANSVHPNGKGSMRALRKAVATVVGEALLGPAPATNTASD